MTAHIEQATDAHETTDVSVVSDNGTFHCLSMVLVLASKDKYKQHFKETFFADAATLTDKETTLLTELALQLQQPEVAAKIAPAAFWQTPQHPLLWKDVHTVRSTLQSLLHREDVSVNNACAIMKALLAVAPLATLRDDEVIRKSFSDKLEDVISLMEKTELLRACLRQPVDSDAAELFQLVLTMFGFPVKCMSDAFDRKAMVRALQDDQGPLFKLCLEHVGRYNPKCIREYLGKLPRPSQLADIYRRIHPIVKGDLSYSVESLMSARHPLACVVIEQNWAAIADGGSSGSTRSFLIDLSVRLAVPDVLRSLLNGPPVCGEAENNTRPHQDAMKALRNMSTTFTIVDSEFLVAFQEVVQIICKCFFGAAELAAQKIMSKSWAQVNLQALALRVALENGACHTMAGGFLWARAACYADSHGKPDCVQVLMDHLCKK